MKRHRHIPHQPDRRGQALVQAHYDAAAQDRQQHDGGRTLVRWNPTTDDKAKGATEKDILFPSGQDVVLHHNIGTTPEGWRVSDLSLPVGGSGPVDGVIRRSRPAPIPPPPTPPPRHPDLPDEGWDSRIIILRNDATVDVLARIEVW